MALEFWQGTDDIGAAKKSDLPFDTITNPGCMAVRNDTAVTVYVGSATTGGQMVASGTNGDDYAAWTDLTDSLSIVKPIKALIII